MTTTIAPSSGAGVLFTQQGVGTTPGYSALDLRRSEAGSVQEGVYGLGASAQDFMAQQRIAGANMQVEITMPTGGMAAVQGDTVNGQGLYDVPVHSANILETIGTADPTNPRVDQIILEVQDNVLDASGGNQARTRVVAGTPTGGANLTNRTGVAALPGSALLLADVLVGAAASSITNSVIRDRRKMARGVNYAVAETAADYTTTASLAQFTTTQRFECSGVPVTLTVSGEAQTAGAIAGQTTVLYPFVDGVLPTEYGTLNSATVNGIGVYNAGAAGTLGSLAGALPFTPSAGSHVIAVAAVSSTAGGIVRRSATRPFRWGVRETIAQNVANNTVTSG